MGFSVILAQIDREIAQLQHARSMLAGGVAAAKPKKTATAAQGKKPVVVKKKRNSSLEGRKSIAEAVQRRWAEQKKSAIAK